MNKKSFIKYVLLGFMLVFCFSFLTFKLRADSGWDSDYDSGWDSGSDWGSSSWDSNWGSSSSSYSSLSGSLITFVIVVAVIIYVIYTTSKGAKNPTRLDESYNDNINSRLSEEEIKKTLSEFNKEEFLNYAYELFINVQNAWMNFDYDNLRKYLSDELFNTYKSQLRVLNAKKQKNIMSDFVKYDIDTTKISNVDNKVTLTVELIVAFYDYVVDANDNVVRGNRSRKLTNHYELTFICSESKNKNKPNKCPNCNAPLDNNASHVCPYCNSTIVSEHYNWIMSKKEIKK